MGACSAKTGVSRGKATRVAWNKGRHWDWLSEAVQDFENTWLLWMRAEVEMIRSHWGQQIQMDVVERQWEVPSFCVAWWRNMPCVSSCWQAENQLGSSLPTIRWLHVLQSLISVTRIYSFCGKPEQAAFSPDSLLCPHRSLRISVMQLLLHSRRNNALR